MESVQPLGKDLEKSYNENWEKDQNEWTFERKRMDDKIRDILETDRDKYNY